MLVLGVDGLFLAVAGPVDVIYCVVTHRRRRRLHHAAAAPQNAGSLSPHKMAADEGGGGAAVCTERSAGYIDTVITGGARLVPYITE